MRAWAGIVVAVLAGGALFAVTAGDGVWIGPGGERRTDSRSVYEIRPGRGIGPVRIGMSRAEAERAMKATGQAVDSFVRFPKSPPVLAMERHAFQVYFDRADRVVGIEVSGPTSDWQGTGAQAEFIARYDGLDVFRTPAKRLVEAVSRRANARPVVTELGSTLTFPALGIGMWREIAEARYFDTVGVDPPKGARS